MCLGDEVRSFSFSATKATPGEIRRAERGQGKHSADAVGIGGAGGKK